MTQNDSILQDDDGWVWLHEHDPYARIKHRERFLEYPYLSPRQLWERRRREFAENMNIL